MNTSNCSNHTSRIAASIFAVLACAAQARSVADLDLPAQSLDDSLRAIAAQTDSNTIFEDSLIAGRSARPLKIRAGAEEALAKLLAGTGLVYSYIDEKTVAIRLAQASGPSAAATLRGTEPLPQVALIEEVVITGTQIRGIENKTAPLTVLSRDYIDATGLTTTTRLIESLPQNFGLANQSGVATGVNVSGSREQAAAINLRGIGEGTTLVLLNGRRLAPGFRSAAVDISALPLTALERVEVLTDGASALYGSDAVGGVVNFILRDDFEGAQTRLRVGSADGTNEYRASQALGNAWSSGNALLSLEYYKRDLLLASDRDFVPTNAIIGSLLPEDENYSAVFTGTQQLTGAISAFADVLYAQRDSSNQGGRTTFGETGAVDNPTGNGTLGLDWQVGGDWLVEVSASYGRHDLNVDRRGRTQAGQPNNSVFNSLFESQSAQAKADGTVLELPGGNLRAAIGVDWRSDSYADSNRSGTGVLLTSTDTEQIVRSAFTELYIPIVGEPNGMAGVRALELSLAGRYDDYSSFGNSFDPQYGLMWEPVSGLRLRGRYGTSYKAPNLVDYTASANSAAAVRSVDPGAPGGFSYQLQVSGIAVDGLRAQASESTSFGLDFAPDAIDGLTMALNYYRIKYSDRIANPPLPQVTLGDPAAYGSLFIRNPSIDQVNQFIAFGQLGRGFTAFDPVTFLPDPNFQPGSVQVIVDARRRNLSIVDTDGLDFSTQYAFDAGAGRFAVGVDATYVLKIEQQITSTSTPTDTVGTISNPPDWRVRANLSWQRGGWASNLFVNHTDDYVDNRMTTPRAISAYTTADARVAYSFGAGFVDTVLSGITIAASVQNLLDEDPPSTAVLNPAGDLGFDPTNASPLGRLFGLEISKTW